MAKVFISFLGTSPYSKVTYVYSNGEKEVKSQTRFVQSALVRGICKDWTPDDKIMIFRTVDSNKVNWLDKTDKSGSTVKGLKSELTHLLQTEGITAKLNPGEGAKIGYIVPIGFSEEEIWDIFFRVYDRLQDGDEIYFDVTHAFRTIPIFTTILFNFSRFMKRTIVKSLHYGAYEKAFDSNEKRALPDEKKAKIEVPLVDLTNIIRLQEVNDAVSNFKQFGDMGSIVRILDDDRKTLVARQQNDVEKGVAMIQRAMQELNFYTQTSNLSALMSGEYFKTVNDVIDPILDSTDIPGPQRELLCEITNELDDAGFVPESSYRNIIAAITWSAKKNLIQQATTVTSEYVKETFLRLYGKNGYKVSDNDYKNKDAISYILLAAKEYMPHTDSYRFKDNNWDRQLRKKFNDNRVFLAADVTGFINLPKVCEMEDPYSRLNKLRNGLNHAAKLNCQSMNDLRRSFESIWNSCLKVMADLDMADLWK